MLEGTMLCVGARLSYSWYSENPSFFFFLRKQAISSMLLFMLLKFHGSTEKFANILILSGGLV